MRVPRIYLKSVRDLGRMRGRAVLIVLVIAASVAFTVGLLYTAAVLGATTEDIYDRGNLPDYYVQGPLDSADRSRLDDAGIVAEAAYRQRVRSVVETRDDAIPGLVYTLEDNPTVDRPILVAGRLDLEPGEALVGTNLRNFHGYGVGDEIVLRTGARQHDLEVVGVVLSPSNLVAAPSGAVPVQLPERTSLVFVSPAELPGQPNYAALETRVRGDFEDRLEDALSGADVVARADEFSYDAIQADLTFFQGMTIPFFAMLAAVSLIIVYTTTAKLVRSRIVEIGVLEALGYTKREVITSQLLTLALLSGIGAVLGSIGALGFGWAFASLYRDVLSLPYLRAGDPAGYVLAGSVLGTVIPLAASLVPMRTIVGLTPREAFSGAHTSGTGGRRLPLEGVVSRISRVPSLSLYALRNLTRRPVYTSLTIVGIALAAGVAGTWVFPMDSIGVAVSEGIDTQQWDIAAEAAGPLDPETVRQLESTPGIREAEPYRVGSFTLPERLSRTDERYALTGVAKHTDMIDPPMVAGRMPTADDEIALSTSVAVLEDVSLSERITVEADGQTRTLTTVGIYRTSSKDAYVLRNEPANALYLRSSEPVERTDDVIGLSVVASAVNIVELRSGIRELTESIQVYLYVGAAVGAVIAVLFTFSNITLEVFRRREEYNVVRALGYSKREIMLSIGTEIVVQGVLAAIPGVLIGIVGGSALYTYAMRLNDIYGYRMVLDPQKFLLMFVLIVGSMVLVVYPAYLYLTRMDITELNRKGAG